MLVFLGPPYFTTPPQNTSVLLGKEARLSCKAEGEPKPFISWTFQNKPIDQLNQDIIITEDQDIRIKRVQMHHNGMYVCMATNKIGTVYAKASLFVQILPKITQPPLELITAKPGSKVILRCRASGNPKPLVIWMREDERTFLLAGESTDTLEVNKAGDVTVEEAFESMHLVCFVANLVGSDVARSRIQVQDNSIELGVQSPKTKKEALKGGVEIGQVLGVSPTSIRVSWHLQDPMDVQLVDGFYILYRQTPEEQSDPTGFTSITVLHAAATSYAINRLLPHTKYEFLVIPFQRGLAGKPSVLYSAWTQEIRPELPPTGLNWSQTGNGGAVKVSWKPLVNEKFRGMPSGYSVSI